MKKFIIMSAALMALASCSKDQNESVTTDVVADNSEVTFDTGIEAVTLKGTPVEGTKLEQNFGVFAYKEEDNKDQDDLYPNFMYNQLVTYSSSKFSYWPSAYWPSMACVNFFAYTPYHLLSSTEFEKPKHLLDKGWPEVKYKVKSVVKDQEDFMISEVLHKNGSDKTVKFHFKHALTKIGFLANVEGIYSSTLKIKSIKVKDVKDTGEFSYKDYTKSESEWWKNVSGNADYTVGLLNSEGITVHYKICSSLGDYTKLHESDQYLLAMPQSFRSNHDAKIEVSYTLTEGSKTEEYTAYFDLKDCDEWEPGCCIMYCLKFKLDKVDIDAVVQPWKDCKEEELWVSGY